MPRTLLYSFLFAINPKYHCITILILHMHIFTYIIIDYMCFHSLYRGTGYFNFKGKGQSFTLQQCQTTYSIKCYFTLHADDQQIMLGQRQELLSHLKVSLHEICQMYIPSARQPIGYIECPLEHDKKCLPHVRLNSITASNDVFCPRSDCKIVPKKAYMMLLATVTDKGIHLFQYHFFKQYS